jgi:hypothetical protein
MIQSIFLLFAHIKGIILENLFFQNRILKHDVISIKGEGGKHAIRVYPPWEKSLNR